MKLSKVGNHTNSQDPHAVCSRIFVGNLNTFQCSKSDVERMFQCYGRLAGISMHRGFAFIQFTNLNDAKNACLGEDGRTVLGQTLDVNLVAEPKPHQIGRKRQNLNQTGNDWEYYYDSYYASVFPKLRHQPKPFKRARLSNQGRLAHQMSPPPPLIIRKMSGPPISSQQQSISSQNKTYTNPDILICGNCREMFDELDEMRQHKRTYCKLRFTCKCEPAVPRPHSPPNQNGLPTAKMDATFNTSLLCVHCKKGFDSAWDLIVHLQTAHMVSVFETKNVQSSFQTPTPVKAPTPLMGEGYRPVSANDFKAKVNGQGETSPAKDTLMMEGVMENGEKNNNNEMEEEFKKFLEVTTTQEVTQPPIANGDP